MEYEDVLGDILHSYTHQMSNVMAVGPGAQGSCPRTQARKPVLMPDTFDAPSQHRPLHF